MTERQSLKKVTFSDPKPDLTPAPRLFSDPKSDRANAEQQITENYGLLTSKVELIGDKVERILTRHEKDFMSAFRAHMFQVQKQLVEMKKRVDDSEARLRRDQQILALEAALSRIQEAALYLESSANVHKQEAEHWKSKALELENERDFLQKQAVLFMRQLSIASKGTEEVTLPALKPSPATEKEGGYKGKSEFGQWLDGLARKHAVSNGDFLQEIEMHAVAMQNHFESALVHMKSTLADCRKQIRSLQSNASTIASERSELEGLFLDCVEEVKREIAGRRGVDGKGKWENRDKGKVMELLFSNDRLLGFLYEKMFRSSGNGFSGRSSMMADRHISANQSEEMILKELAGVSPEPAEPPVKESRRSKSSSSSKAKKRKDIVVVDGKLMLAK